MAQKMLRFTTIAQRFPAKRAAEKRRRDFAEISGRFPVGEARDQSARCEQCGVPYCQIHCPLHNNIPDWLRLTAEGRHREAYDLAASTNTLPEITGRICPQDRLCEGSCVLEQSAHGTVTIGAVEAFITEMAFDEGWVQPPVPAEDLPSSVAIVGSGPAGLAAAEVLRRHGHQVHIFDRHGRAGGLLVYGIPNFKLDKSVVARRVRLLEAAGVVFHLGCEVGQDVSLAELRATHDAVLIATGVYKANDIALPGAGLDAVVPALDFLIASNRVGFGDAVPAFAEGTLNAAGRKVVVVGGGDTAMDCVRTAVRQGAASVTCLYRRDRANMPGSQREVQHAEEEGVIFEWLAAPKAFLGNGTVRGLRAQRMHLGMPGPEGRQRPQPLDGSDFDIEADLLIKALGFAPEDLPARFVTCDLAVSRRGTLVVDPATKMTSLDGVFAAGDIVRGASLVVWAIRDGIDAADNIHGYLQAKALLSGIQPDAASAAL